jgi:hypothetical protein
MCIFCEQTLTQTTMKSSCLLERELEWMGDEVRMTLKSMPISIT